MTAPGSPGRDRDEIGVRGTYVWKAETTARAEEGLGIGTDTWPGFAGPAIWDFFAAHAD